MKCTPGIRAELIARIAKKTGDAQGIMDTVYETRNRLFNTQPALQKAVEKIAQEAVHGQAGWKEGMSFRTGLDSALRAAHAELGSVGKMLDPRTMETAKLVMSEEHTGPHPTPNTYNWVHLNRETIRKLEKATRGMVQYYVRRLWNPHAEPARLHPGEMIRAVRDQTQLTRSEWRAFCRIRPVMFLNAGEFPTDEEQPSTLRLICKAVAEANQPRASGARLGCIVNMRQQCRFYHRRPVGAWGRLESMGQPGQQVPGPQQADRGPGTPRGHKVVLRPRDRGYQQNRGRAPEPRGTGNAMGGRRLGNPHRTVREVAQGNE